MRFDLDSLTSVVYHLKAISRIYTQTKNERVIFCPYCDDATRNPNPSHGHLNVSTEYPVFLCFRCGKSGTLIQLLIDTEFSDEETLTYLGSFVRYNFSKDVYREKKRSFVRPEHTVVERVRANTREFCARKPDIYNQFEQYVISRIGHVNFTEFLISPGMLLDNRLCCDFYNRSDELVASRLVENLGKIRYKLHGNSSGLYYFQELDFDKYDTLTITEGGFDAINLFLYQGHVLQNSVYASVSGKKYYSAAETFVMKHLLIGNYRINVVFDSDVANAKAISYRIRRMVKTYNSDIETKFYFPAYTKDVGEFPEIREIQ